MSGLISELISVLNEQSNIYEQLCGISMHKKEMIIINDIEELKKITSSENLLLGKIQRIDKIRVSLIEDIACVLNEEESDITLSALANIINDQPDYNAFIEAVEKLRNTLDALKNLNEQNKQLIQNSLEYIDFSINVIRSTFSDEPSFFTTKGEELPQVSSFFDARN